MRHAQKSALFSVILASSFVCLSNAGARGDEYEFIHVDDFLADYGLGECYIFDLNDNNVGCGTATKAFQMGGSTTITYSGFYWSPENEKTAVSMSWPRGISDSGVMAGVLQLYDIGNDQFTNMPLLPSTYAPLVMLHANDAGRAVGYVQICNCSNSQGVLQIPYLWDPEEGARTLAVPGANGAAKINNNDMVIGWIGGWSASNSYLYNLNTETYMLMSSVFEGPNVKTTAADINDLDVVVGSRKNSNGSITWGYTWSAETGATLLPLPPAGYQPYVNPISINDAGTIVGTIALPNGTSRPFVYDKVHGIRDLTTLTTPIPGFTMITVTAINNNGWISGYGSGGGAGFYTSFILKPFAAPALPGDMNADGTVDGADLGLLLSAWGTDDAKADLNGDGIVDGADLGLLLGSWG